MMSRLYYERPLDRPQLAAGASVPAEFTEKIIKLIPSEIVVAYTFIVGLIPLIGNQSLHLPISLAVFGLCLVLTPIYLNRLAEENKPKTAHLILSAIAFVVWAYTISGHLVLPAQYYDPPIASIALIAFTLVSGIIPLTV